MLESENDEILKNKEVYFECNHIDDLKGYDLLKKNIKITPQNAIFDDTFKIRLVSNPKSPYGFSSCCYAKRSDEGYKWEYMGFGHSGAASVVTALLKELNKLKNELKEVSQIRDNNFINAYELRQKLKQIKEIATKRNYLDHSECLNDILDLISKD